MTRNVVALAHLTIAMGFGLGVCADPAAAQDRPLSADFPEVYRAGGMNAQEWAFFANFSHAGFDADGNLYVLDASAGRVVVLDSQGRLARIVGRRRSGFVEVDLDNPAIDSVFAVMKRNGTVLDATLRIVVQIGQRRMAAIDTVGARPPGDAGDTAQTGPDPRRELPVDRRRRGVRPRCDTADAFALTRRAYEAGVMIAAGTDGMTPPDSVFPALYDEIRLLHEDVGMPMLDVLKAASLHGAVALGMEDEIGTLEPGKHANIAFLGEDPLAGPESLRSVALTVKRGTLYYRQDFVLGEPPERPAGPPGR